MYCKMSKILYSLVICHLSFERSHEGEYKHNCFGLYLNLSNFL